MVVHQPLAGRRILILSRYAAQAASSRLRQFQFIPALEAAGAEVQVLPFFDAVAMEHFFRSRRTAWDVARAYMKRLAAMCEMARADIAWIQYDVFPFIPAFISTRLIPPKVPIVLDYDDAIFHAYDQHRYWVVRRVLGNRLVPLLKRASSVVVGNAYLAGLAKACTDSPIIRLPTVLDTARYPVLPEPPDDEFRVGWIGGPATTRYLDLLKEPLARLAAQRKVKLVTIGATPLADFGVPVEQHKWSEEAEGRLLGSIHAGVMPLPDEPWERGKCGYKLIQYMAAGRPIVASPVGINTEIATPDVGFLATDAAEWTASLARLADDAGLRATLGARGRERAEKEYSVAAIAPKIVETLAAAAASSRPNC